MILGAFLAGITSRRILYGQHPYQGGYFRGEFREGSPYNGRVEAVICGYQGSFSGILSDRSLKADHNPRFQRSGTSTPFQRFIRDGARLSNLTREEKLQVFFGCNLPESDPVSLSKEEKLDIANDPIRRVFESYFAKYLLEKIAKSDHYDLEAMKSFSDEQLKFEEEVLGKEALKEWKSACGQAPYKGAVERMRQLNIRHPRAEDALSQINNLGDDWKDFFLETYKRFHLNHFFEKSDFYKNEFPSGILDIYRTDSLYVKRGRLNGESRIIDSLHLGNLRNTDPAPHDLRSSFLPSKARNSKGKLNTDEGIYTRCPDQLNMADPDGPVDRDKDSWLTHIFRKGVYSHPYVNGLSGTALVEMRTILAFKKKRNCVGSNLEAIKIYLRVVSCLFIYADGGHCIGEIVDILNHRAVKDAFQETLQTSMEKFPEMVFDLEDGAICSALDKAIQHTKQVDQAFFNKKRVQEELSKRGKYSAANA